MNSDFIDRASLSSPAGHPVGEAEGRAQDQLGLAERPGAEARDLVVAAPRPLTVVYGFAPPARHQLLALHPVQGRIEAAERDPALAPGQGQDLVDDLKAIELLARGRRRDQDLRVAAPRHLHLFSPYGYLGW